MSIAKIPPSKSFVHRVFPYVKNSAHAPTENHVKRGGYQFYVSYYGHIKRRRRTPEHMLTCDNNVLGMQILGIKEREGSNIIRPNEGQVQYVYMTNLNRVQANRVRFIYLSGILTKDGSSKKNTFLGASDGNHNNGPHINLENIRKIVGINILAKGRRWKPIKNTSWARRLASVRGGHSSLITGRGDAWKYRSGGLRSKDSGVTLYAAGVFSKSGSILW